MRKDITWMVGNLAEGGRYIRVSPAHWDGGYYEIIIEPGSADVVRWIHNTGWAERSKRVIERGLFRIPRRRAARQKA